MKLSIVTLAVSLSLASSTLMPLEPVEPTLVLADGDTSSLITVEEYVARVVAHEVPYTFCDEALKAQAVAARTYLYYCLEHGSHPHDHADVCTDITHCCGYITEQELDERYGDGYGEAAFERIRSAVRATEGEVLTYNDKAILSVWHASSDGSTEDCAEVWSGALPYLVSVPTPEREVPYTVSFTLTETVRRLRDAGYPYNAAMSAKMTLTDSGRCSTLTLGSMTLSGSDVRSIFGLKSTDFLAWWRGGRLYFRVRGYGHGVGMSQVGANVMAESGATYREILAHYYVGSEISDKKY